MFTDVRVQILPCLWIMSSPRWLAGMPFGFSVEGGPELRDTVASLAARFTAAVGPL